MNELNLSDTQPFTSLDEGLNALIKCLEQAIPMRLWMVTRVTGNDWTVLHSADQEGLVKRGDVFPWSDSYCSRMVRGEGPRFAPRAQDIAAYKAAPINGALKIGAYIGHPLTDPDGALLGTLCAVDATVQDEFTPEQKYLVSALTRTMSTLISDYLKLEHARVVEAQLRYRAETDPLTGLSNRHAWENALAAEEGALGELGENAMVMMIDLDGLKVANDTKGHAEGDKYLLKAAAVLKEQLRDADVLARIGGDEFAVLIRGITKEQGLAVFSRVSNAIEAAGVQASIGHAMRLTQGTLDEAFRIADVRMYENKTRRKRDSLDQISVSRWPRGH